MKQNVQFLNVYLAIQMMHNFFWLPNCSKINQMSPESIETIFSQKSINIFTALDVGPLY